MDPGVPVHSDTYTVRPLVARYHDWEKPVDPWRYWLASLSRPGELVADPFCGSGTIGVALKQIGGRRYIGTEIDPDNIKVPRARLAKVEPPDNLEHY
jgi:site-specific DNA-methyltransferase (adenine-specific)